MDDFELLYSPRITPIPREFFSDATGAPFDRCMLCKTFLLAVGVGYLIEKAYKRHPEFNVEDTVFEYAICESCAMEMSSKMSTDSMEKITAYFQGQVDFAARSRYLIKEESTELKEWVGNCVVKGTEREEMREYQTVGQFIGEKMIYHTFPYMIGGVAMKEVSLLLSNETLGEIDGFMENFGLPPELRELWKDRPLILI